MQNDFQNGKILVQSNEVSITASGIHLLIQLGVTDYKKR